MYFGGFRPPGSQRETDELLWIREVAANKARLRIRQKAKLKERVRELTEILAEQALLNQALLKILLQKARFTEEEFISAVTKVDLLDGEADGRFKRRKPEKKPAEAPLAKTASPKPKKKRARRVRRRPR